MNENLSKASDRFIEGIGRLANTVGVSRVIGQLYALLFLSNRPFSLNDMGERAGFKIEKTYRILSTLIIGFYIEEDK